MVVHVTGPHGDSVYSGSQHNQFDLPRLVKHEAGSPSPRWPWLAQVNYDTLMTHHTTENTVSLIYHDITYSTAMTAAGHISPFELTKETPYLTLTKVMACGHHLCQVRCGMSFMRLWEKNDHIITRLHWTWLLRAKPSLPSLLSDCSELRDSRMASAIMSWTCSICDWVIRGLSDNSVSVVLSDWNETQTYN